MTTPSANPRRFSRGLDNLDPNQPLNIYLSLIVPKQRESMRDAFAVVERYREDWPQAVVEIVAYSDEGATVSLTVEIQMGPMRAALNNELAQTQAGYGYCFSIVKNCFHLRPVFTGPPTDHEREAFAGLMAKMSA